MPSVDQSLLGKPGSLLFGTPKKPLIPKFNVRPQVSNTPSNLGYFAFPPGVDPATYAFSDNALDSKAVAEVQERARREEKERLQQEEEELAWKAEQENMLNLRKQRLAREAEEGRRGEEYWVSCGGVLRDEEGKRDLVRTEAIREELRLRAVEKRLMDLWENYERRWAELLIKIKDRGKSKDTVLEKGAGDVKPLAFIRFVDIPWPVDSSSSKSKIQDVELQDLTLERIEEFLLGGLKVRGCKVTKKERVRSSLLRWHPDKVTAIMAKVIPGDLEGVQQAINTVMSCLHQMNTRV